MNSFEAITRSLRAEHFDPVSRNRNPVVPFKRDKVFFHSGDYGDVIYALPTIRALGGGRLVIGPSSRWKTRLTFNKEHVETIAPLLRLQPYIHDVEFSEGAPPDMDLDLNQFREYLITEYERIRRGSRRLSLAEAHLYTFKLNLKEWDRAWLDVDQMEIIPNKSVLINRSARWRNDKFPWKKVMDRHGHHAAFVGLESEYADFIKDFGYLPYRPTADILELARLIAGCRLFIGNQSLPYAICEGLKRDSVLEVWTEGPNCLSSRDNAIYGESATVYIPKINDKPMNTKLEKCPLCGTDSEASQTFREGSDIVQCPSCSLVYLRTQPDTEQTLRYYQNYASDASHMRLPKSVDEIKSSGLRREYFMQQLLQVVQPPGNMLDIGCGWGAFLANAREKGFSPYGVDVCHKAANFSATVLSIPTVCDIIEDCQFTDGMFDAIVMIHTLEHLANPISALKIIHKLLKPGKIYAGIVPNIESLCSSRRKEKWLWLDKNTHYVHFSPATLKASLEQNGFEVLRMYTETGDYSGVDVCNEITAREGRALSVQEMNDTLKQLWAAGQGEEIRFFVKAI